jgi:hypothetical protein
MEIVSKSRYNPKAAESQALEIILMMIREQTEVEDSSDVKRHFQIQIFLIFY